MIWTNMEFYFDNDIIAERRSIGVIPRIGEYVKIEDEEYMVDGVTHVYNNELLQKVEICLIHC